MPELPEVEAWVRELDPLVSAAPVLQAGPAHIATLKTFDPPLRELEGRRFAGAGRRGKWLLFPTADKALQLRVHLMSAGTDPAPRLRRQGAEDARVQAPLRERRRARADRGRAEEARRRLARVARADRRPSSRISARRHSGSASSKLRAILAGDNRRLHSLLRDQRALAGIGRAHANEILHRAQLSPFALSGNLDDAEIERLAAAIEDDLTRALELRLAGKGDKDVYLVHRKLGEPCPRCGDPLRQVDYEEHTVFYCAPCQTGGRVLKDRRMSRLLR